MFAALPKPKYTGEEEEQRQSVGPRIIGADQAASQQLQVAKRSGIPAYGSRNNWRPRGNEDFGDGGAYPEVSVAQYPLDMGRKHASSSNALTLSVNAEGQVDYTAIAKRGHAENRIVHASFKDLIPLRHQANAGEISLARPDEETVAETKRKTELALATLVAGASAAQRPKNVKGVEKREASYVRYTPANQMGNDHSKKGDRIMKIMSRQIDPMEPPKFKAKKIPGRPPSPPPPVMHSPPRKLTAEDQEAWRIPPTVSNWKNPKGYTVPLDKRLAADGRGLQDVTINDKFASFAEALQTADRHAREEVKSRALMQQRLAEKEKEQKEENLRLLAQKAREEKASTARGGAARAREASRSRSRSRSRSISSYSSRSRSGSAASEDHSRAEREKLRAARRADAQREMRQKNMGHERRMQTLARNQNRDISEKVALGLAKPTQSKETMYDSRLFNQSSGFASAGFNEDQAYDKPLFADREALNSIYRPQLDQDDGEDGGETLESIQKTSRFETLGRAPKEGMKSARAAEQREGPVVFERDNGDPFGVDQMIKDAQKGGNKEAQGSASVSGQGVKRYGLNEGGEEEERGSKRARIEDDDED
ncbi:pre-mRNA-processing protein 45 [Aureobasidium subglaciale]|nr:pre-mRNA-processing protein 45 [Aureobasidium subglaciale]KAI5275989.1 pre-mRNA-processing protein 45 [Aureobasidium subglaciale]